LGTRAAQVTAIFRDIHRTCRALAIAVTGGHTEVTDAVTRPIVAGDMQGLLVTRRLITSGGARPGDVVLMSKAAGLEGTAILATGAAGGAGRPPPRPDPPARAPARPLAGHLRRPRCAPCSAPRGQRHARSDRGRRARRAARGGVRVARPARGRPRADPRAAGD